MSSDYLELCEEARDALRAVIKLTEPGTGMPLHYAYAELARTIEKNTAPKAQPKAERRPDWMDVSTVKEREREVLGILSEHRLTNRELMDHLREAHADMGVWLSNVVSVVTRLYKARELDRVGVPARNGQTMYRYFRRTDLDGPIADLDRTFHAEEEGS